MADYPDGIIPTSTTISIDQTGLAKDDTVQNILNQLDITLTQLRDALRGSGNKSFTDVDADLLDILGKLDITLSQFRNSLKGANDKSLSDLDLDLLSILGQLDITLSQLRDDLKGSGAKTLTDVESDLSDILGQLDIKISEIKAVNTQTPRTLSEVYDELTSILGQLDITISQLRDALLGTESKTLTDVAGELEKTTAMDLISNGEVSFADTENLTTEKKTSAIQMPDDCYPGRIYYLAIEKPTENTAGDLTVTVYNLVKIDGVNEREVLHSIHTVEAVSGEPSYRGFLIQGLGFGEGKIKLGFKFASDSGAITVKWALFK